MTRVKTDPTQPVSGVAHKRLKRFLENPIKLDKKTEAMMDTSLREVLRQNRKKPLLVRTMEKIRKIKWIKKDR